MPTSGMKVLLRFPVRDSIGALACPAAVQKVTEDAKYSAETVRKAELIAAELSTNVVRHGGGGVVSVFAVAIPEPGIAIVAEDQGPGFTSVEIALEDGVSQGVRLIEQIPTQRASLGAGLGAIKRLADELGVENIPGGGARVTAYVRTGAPAR